MSDHREFWSMVGSCVVILSTMLLDVQVFALDADGEEVLRPPEELWVNSVETPVGPSPENTSSHLEHVYSVASWLPNKEKLSSLGGKVNLAFIPALAFLFFLAYICVKARDWYHESKKGKEMGYMEDYSILKHGDEEFMDVDLRSDSSVCNTVSSYASFLRSGSNYNTWNSVRPVQVVPPLNVEALYKAFLMQRKESIHSNKGLTQKPVTLKDAEVQVDLIGKDVRKGKPNDNVLYVDETKMNVQTKLTGSTATGSESMEPGSDLVCHDGGSVEKNSQPEAAGNESRNAARFSGSKSVITGTSGDDGPASKYQKKQHRFNVSFVTDDCGNVVSSSRPNSNTISTHLDSPNLSPSSILTHSTFWPNTSEI